MAVPFWLLGGTIPEFSLWWQPVVAGALFFAGQVFTLLALTTGDVSVATPVLGLKIVLVALLSVVLIGDPDRRAPLDGGGVEQRRHRTAESQSRAFTSGVSREPSSSPRLAQPRTRLSMCWCRSSLPCGAQDGFCRWRWPAALRIQSRCPQVVAPRSAVNRVPTPLGSRPAPCVSPCKV